MAGKWQRLSLFDGLQRLRQRPDVVVGEPQRLDLRQLRLVRKSRQHEPQLFEGHVEHVHPVALAVVGLRAPKLLYPGHFSRSSGRRPSLASSSGLPLRSGALEPAAASSRYSSEICIAKMLIY